MDYQDLEARTGARVTSEAISFGMHPADSHWAPAACRTLQNTAFPSGLRASNFSREERHINKQPHLTIGYSTSSGNLEVTESLREAAAVIKPWNGRWALGGE